MIFSSSISGRNSPSADNAERTSGPTVASETHDDTRQRLRLRLRVTTLEAMRSFAGAQGVSQGGLLDALLHGLEVADPSWLGSVIERARRLDASLHEGDRTSTNDASRA